MDRHMSLLWQFDNQRHEAWCIDGEKIDRLKNEK